MAIWPAKHVRPQREDPQEAAQADPPEDARTDPLPELVERLDQLRELFEHTNQQVVEYLLRRSCSPAAVNLQEAEEALRPKLENLVEKLQRQCTAVGEGVGRLQQTLEAGIERLSQLLQPAESQPAPLASAASGEWSRIVFGPQEVDDPELQAQQQQLLNGLIEGDPGACALVGQLLVFRSAPAEKMSPLLKEIGEAYYRWRPKTQAGVKRMEQLLVDWLCGRLQEAGIGNTIELVHPGERFDAARHSASSPGVEVAEVHGWVVLRDNGRVYTKASVSAK